MQQRWMLRKAVRYEKVLHTNMIFVSVQFHVIELFYTRSDIESEMMRFDTV